MKKYKAIIIQEYKYEIEIDAKSKAEALRKTKHTYENVKDGYIGVADGITYNGVRFKVVEED